MTQDIHYELQQCKQGEEVNRSDIIAKQPTNATKICSTTASNETQIMSTHDDDKSIQAMCMNISHNESEIAIDKVIVN